MKSTQATQIIIALFLSLGIFTSCQEEEEILTLTDEEAVEIVEAALTSSTAGVSYATESSAGEILTNASVQQVCDSLVKKSYQVNQSGSRGSANYDLEGSYAFSCNALGIPTSARVHYKMEGSWSTPRMSSQDSTSFQADASGLQPSADTLVFDISYQRGGDQNLSLANTRNASSQLQLDLNRVKIDKSSLSIASGGGTYSLTGTSQQGSFSLSGTITFLGNRQATIVVNGQSYLIDLN